MKKIILAIALIASFTANVKAQDEAIFNHYIINPMLINPAYAGFDDNVVLFGHLRSQWAGYEKAGAGGGAFLPRLPVAGDDFVGGGSADSGSISGIGPGGNAGQCGWEGSDVLAVDGIPVGRGPGGRDCAPRLRHCEL